MAELRGRDLSALDWVAIVLAVIGALNWGLVGLFDFNLVSAIFGPMSAVSRIVYVLVGLAGLYLFYMATRPSLSDRITTGGLRRPRLRAVRLLVRAVRGRWP